MRVIIADDIVSVILRASDNLRPVTKMKTVKSALLSKLREIIAQIGRVVE